MGDMTVSNGDTMDYSFDLGLTGRDIATISWSRAGDIPLAVYAAIQKAQSAGKSRTSTR